MLHLAVQIYVLLMENGNFLINRQNWNVNNRSSSGVELVYRSGTLLGKKRAFTKKSYKYAGYVVSRTSAGI